MKRHYCANCGHWSDLADGVYCAWCLKFFLAHRRLPGPGESL